MTENRDFCLLHLHSMPPLGGLRQNINSVADSEKFWRCVYWFRQNPRTWQACLLLMHSTVWQKLTHLSHVCFYYITCERSQWLSALSTKLVTRSPLTRFYYLHFQAKALFGVRTFYKQDNIRGWTVFWLFNSSTVTRMDHLIINNDLQNSNYTSTNVDFVTSNHRYQCSICQKSNGRVVSLLFLF